MMIRKLAALTFLGAVTLCDTAGFAADPKSNPVVSQAGNQAGGGPVYIPPKLGAPRGRVGGGARAAEIGIPRLTVLAPDHPGRTVEGQPVLYWFISGASKDPIEFTLMSEDQIRPLIETRLANSAQAGVHKVSLTEYGLKLKPFTTYRWYVTVVRDPTRRAKDVIAGGVIEHVEMPDALSAQLANAKAEDKPKILAAAGIWYDAIAALSSLIDASPRNKMFREQRAALLEQIGLQEVAGYDLAETQP